MSNDDVPEFLRDLLEEVKQRAPLGGALVDTASDRDDLSTASMVAVTLRTLRKPPTREWLTATGALRTMPFAQSH